MGIRKTQKLNKILSALTGSILVLSSLLPGGFFGVEKAEAATFTYSFSSSADYTTDTHSVVHNGAAQSKITFADRATTDLSAVNTVRDLITPTSANLGWMATSSGPYKSTNAGVTWVPSAAGAGLNEVDPYEFVQPTADNATNLIVVGEVGGIPGAAWSTNYGTNWSATTIDFDGEVDNSHFTEVTYDSTHNYTFAASFAGKVYRSTDGGENFTHQANLPIVAITDIVWTGGNNVVATGTGGVAYSTNAGASWTLASLPGSDPPVFTATGVSNGYVYAGGAGYMARALATSDLSVSSNWSDVTAAVTNETITTVRNFMNINGIMFAIVDQNASGTALFSTIDDGTTWLNYGAVAMDAIDISRMFNDGRFLIAGEANVSSDTDVFMGTYFDNDTTVIPTTGINIVSISSVTAVPHAKSETGLVGIAFGSTANGGGTWYYHNGAAWASYTGDDANKANIPATLDAGKLSTIPLTGVVYVKIYLRDPLGVPISTLTVLDALSMEYTDNGGGGGGGGGGDGKAPTSQVDAMEPFTNIASFPVTATSPDADTKTVYLYVSTDGVNFTAWPNDQAPQGDSIRPYSWNFTGSHGTTYYFYSIAVDSSNMTEKPPVEGYDTFTQIDIVAPYITGQLPEDDEVEVARDQSVVIDFSEPMDPDSFTYSFRKTGGAEVPAQDEEWNNDYTALTITHDQLLDYATSYTVKVETAEDRAGNDIVEEADCPPGQSCPQPLALTWNFRTVPKQDPDLTRSKITVEETHYGVSQHPEFTVTLTNDSLFTANDASAKINFVDGITYQNGTARIVRGGGQITTEADGNGKTRLVWRGTIAYLEEIVIEFNANISTPTNLTEIAQGVHVYDNVHYFEDDSPYLPTPAQFDIDKSPNFRSSGKTVNKSQAAPGEDLTYTINVINTGATMGDLYFNDVIPDKTAFITGSITSVGEWDSLSYDAISDKITGRASLAYGEWVRVSFRVRIDGNLPRNMDHVIENVATAEDEDVTDSFYTLPTAVTVIPGELIEDGSPEIVYQTPNNEQEGIRPNAEILIGFNKTMDPASLTYRVNLSDGYTVDTSGWTKTWSTFNSQPNAQVKLTPDEDLYLGEEYTIEITNAMDDEGNALASCPQDDPSLCSPNPWSFTVAAPTLRIITRPVDADIVNLPVGTIDEEFVIQVYDQVTGYAYTVDKDTTVRLLTTSTTGKFVREDGRLLYNTANGKWETTLISGRSETNFYYVDSTATPAGTWDTLTAYDYPPQGWGAGIKKVIVQGKDVPRSHLSIHTPKDRVLTNAFTEPIELRAFDQLDRRINLPEGRLYLHTSSTTGTFYNANKQPLPQWITAQGLQANAAGNMQYLDVVGQMNLASIYYKDTKEGFALLTLSDNTPVNPDTGMENASTLMIVGDVELLDEEDMFAELEEVIDDTGRTVSKLVITPDYAELLPGDMQGFSVKAYDQDGKEIEGLKYKWYVIASGGTIEKDGIDGDSTVSLFTAGEEPGRYLSTVLVATLYNGQLAYVTADIDVVDILGLGRLPITGINALQAIFMLLTLLSAIGLAWVEHYEKTHFQK